jgi:hypothetical protein
VSNPLATPEDYELFLYSVANNFPTVHRSTLAFIPRGVTLARVSGEIQFDQGIRLVVRERLVYDRRPMRIDSYGYEVWRDQEKLYWYDSQPHPDDPELASTHPHHKHIPPDLKHHRVPAPALTFRRPNLPHLIREIEEGLLPESVE